MKARDDQYRRQIAALMLRAEAERLAMGELVDGYRRTTEPFDRVYLKVTRMIRARPLVSTLLLGLGGVITVAVGRRLPRLAVGLPWGGLIRGATLATLALRSLRGPSG